MSEEMLEDAPAVDAYLRRKAPEKINFKVDSALISGNGVGKPLGILNSACLVTVTKESSQAADTFLMENAVKMYSRMYAPLLGNSAWFMNQDVMPQLLLMNSRALDVAGSQVYGGQPMYIGPGQLSQAPNGMLLGRPIIYTQACPTVGDLGDIIFADMSQYLAIIKGGIKTDTSMHLWFDYGIMAYRFVLRIGGNPWWGSAITPASGSSNTLSCFVALQAR
jgi:HK97 family phage major capsid protein